MTTKIKRWLDDGEVAPEGAVALLQLAAAPPPMPRSELSRSSIAISVIIETARMLRQWTLRAAAVTTLTALAALGGLWLAAERPGTQLIAPEVVTAAKSSVDPTPELHKMHKMHKNPLGATAKHTAPALEMPALQSVHQEAALLENARKALGTDPHEAMSYVRAHAIEFPTGALIAERELLAIAALSRAGQPEQASQRALEFQRRFPGSTYLDQIPRFLE